MKILHIYKDYYPPVKGGIEGHINVLATGLKERGIGVEVLVSNTSARLERETIDGIRVTKVPQVGRFASASLNMTFAYWIKERGKAADILHFHFPNPTAEISYLISGLRKPVMVTYHSDIIRQARLLKIYTPLLKRFLDQASTIVVTSPNYLESSLFLKDYRDNCHLIPFGIDLSEFSLPVNTTEIAEIHRRHGPALLLFIGRFRYYKGLHILIRAMSHIDAKLLLIGGGPLETRLRENVIRLHLEDKVIFLGELPDVEKIIYLHACDVFVLPSVFRSEAFGIVQLEAMACAKPVVCTELGTGTSFVNLHQQTGLVVPPKDAGAIAVAVNHLLSHPDLLARYGRAGFERVQNCFSKDKMIEDTISLYREMLPAPVAKSSALIRSAPDRRKKIKVLRIISRLNIGGPAIHAFILTKGLDPEKFETVLVTGRKSAHEGDMSYLFESLDNKPIIVEDLQRELNLLKDIRAFIAIVKIIYKERPDIVHTHTTKAGVSARFAVFLFRLIHYKEIKTVHTFHGHVFSGYFNRLISQMIVWVERFLMKLTDTIIAISDSQRRELTRRYHIAPSYKVVTKELGFNLRMFLENENNRGEVRKRLKIDNQTTLIGIVGRLAPIKNHKMFLEIARSFIHEYPGLKVKFIVVGDGELRDALGSMSHRLGLRDAVHFLGWVRDVSMVYSDLDILSLTSLNEGTPVSVIEAMASRIPVISTDAGGVVDLVGAMDQRQRSNGFRVCERGILCRKDNVYGFSQGIKFLIDMRQTDKDVMLDKACTYVQEKYTRQRLIRNIEELYINLMENNAPAASLPGLLKKENQ